MQQSHVGLPVVEQFLLLVRFAEQQIDSGCAGLRAVGVEEFGQQAACGARFDGEDETGRLCAACRVRRSAAATALRIERASDSRTAPASVSVTLRLVRSSNVTPSCRSSRAMARDRGGWAISRRWAALPKCNSSATAAKYRSSRISM
ncbi:hypothetical protein SGRIM119S_00057 [Streptomyces griseorubiginosus]